MDSNITPVPGVFPIQPAPGSQGRTNHRNSGAEPAAFAGNTGADSSGSAAVSASSQQQQQLARAEQARQKAIQHLDQLRQSIATGAYVIDLGPLAQKLLAGGHLGSTRSEPGIGLPNNAPPGGQGGGA